MLKNKRIFISGGAGVIGNELIIKLHDLGAILYVGDLKSRPNSWPSSIAYRQGDLNFISREEIELFKPEVFIHLAATFERSNESYDFWGENYWHNIRLSNYLLSLMKDFSSLERVIFASSYLIYNPSLYFFNSPQETAKRLTETDPVLPRNLIGSAKLLHEMELDFLNNYKSDQFTSVCTRIFRGYGKGSKCVISRWIRDLLRGNPIQVYRKEGRFDFIYAEDTAYGIIRLIENYTIKGIVNLGTDNARSIEEVLNILKSHFPDMMVQESEINIPYEASQANMDLLKNKTGWKPQIKLEDAIPRIIKYESDIMNTPKESLHNILITSISKKIPMIEQVTNAARKINSQYKIFGADIDKNVLGVHFVDEFWHIPKIEDLHLDKLISYCRKNKINSIIPTRDGDLIYFAKHKKDLESHNISVMISDLEITEICLDKLKFYDLYNNTGLKIIPTYTDINEIKSKQYVVKEQFGAGSKSVGINLLKDDAIRHSQNLLHPIFQPFIEGREASIDLYVNRNGSIIGIIMRYRDIVINGESQITTTFFDSKLDQLVRQFVNKKPFFGHIVLQIIIDQNNEYNLVECNPRFGGASTLSIAAGLDSFYWFLLEAQKVDISNYFFYHDYTKKIKQVRYPSDKIMIK